MTKILQKCSLCGPLPGNIILLPSVNFLSYLPLAKFRVQAITRLMVWNIFMKNSQIYLAWWQDMLRQRRIILAALLLVLSALVIGCHRNKKKQKKKKQILKKFISLETIRSISLRLYGYIHICLNRVCVFFFFLFGSSDRLLWELRVSIDLKKWNLLPSHCRYFDKTSYKSYLSNPLSAIWF